MSWIRCLVVVAIFSAPTLANAASGYIKARLTFYQNQGSWCPTTRNCTGYWYNQADFNTNNPVAHTKVFIRNPSNVIIGQGTTDHNGDTLISWSATPAPSTFTLYWNAQHKDGFFAIQSATGLSRMLFGPPMGLTAGTTIGAPQNLGTLTWGTPGAPSQVANAYDGAWREWYYALGYSNRMIINFTGVGIRAFTDANCENSCAYGSANYIELDTQAAFRPQARVMHEMGHIATYKSNPFKSSYGYCYPSTAYPCPTGHGWSTTSAEWRAAAFNEGIATFFADVGLMWANTIAPHTCNVEAAACITGTHNLETSNGAACATDENRWEISYERYIWDIYDSVSENFVFTGDFDSRPFYEIPEVLAMYTNGTNDHDDDEPWNSSRSNLDAHDGRSASDFRYWYISGAYAHDTLGHQSINCAQ